MSKKPQDPSLPDDTASAKPKRVEDLPAFEFSRGKARTRDQSRQVASKGAVFGITSLGDLVKAAQELFQTKKS